jgi:hypothetical protein
MDLWNDLDERDQKLCKDMFGRLTDLIHVPVNWNLIKAIVWFWDDDRRCFVINDNDYSPLIEEYGAIFQGNSVKSCTAYAPSQKTNTVKKLAEYLEVDYADINQEMKEETRVNIKTLVVLRNKLLGKYGSNESKFREIKLKIYVLAAFGLLLFPTGHRIIDPCLYD